MRRVISGVGGDCGRLGMVVVVAASLGGVAGLSMANKNVVWCSSGAVAVSIDHVVI